MFVRLGAAASCLLMSSCGFDWSLPSPPEETSPSTTSDASTTAATGATSSTGEGAAGASAHTSSASTGGSPQGVGGSGANGSGAGGAGGAEEDPCVKCADNFVSLCCDTADCVSELNQALADPSHVLSWQSDAGCPDYDGALACAACSKVCVFQCGDYFPNGYCYDDTWCE